ncbi:Atlastin-1 [Halotydeus destructor]|nr:Atlastin-1 [Halotydeus destructor]
MLLYAKTLFAVLAWQQFIAPSVAQSGGEVVQIVQINQETKQCELKDKALQAILIGPECRDKAVSVISIAGAPGSGKSFLLNFLLKYLTANGAADWHGDLNAPLKGFSWRPGYQRDTCGISMWSKPFVLKRNYGQHVCVLLMDTQCDFDGKHTVAEAASINALSTLLSSVQVYNLMDNLRYIDLENLELFTEYGSLAVEESDAKPFQKLLFLISDFRHSNKFEYGLAGGKKYLEDILHDADTNIAESKKVTANIRRLYETLDCFLMPYPGEKVDTSKAFGGKLGDINALFLRELQVLVPYLLKPENLAVKRINGQDVAGTQLLDHFRALLKVFGVSANNLPTPGVYFSFEYAARKASDMYFSIMEENFGTRAPPFMPSVFESKQTQAYRDAIAFYHGFKKFNEPHVAASTLKELEQRLSESADSYRAYNRLKISFEHKNLELQLQLDILNKQKKLITDWQKRGRKAEEEVHLEELKIQLEESQCRYRSLERWQSKDDHWLGGTIVSCSMNDAMLDEAVFFYDDAAKKSENWDQQASMMETHFSKTYGGSWHCFIGISDQFTGAIRGMTDYFLVYKTNDTQIVLFRSKN